MAHIRLDTLHDRSPILRRKTAVRCRCKGYCTLERIARNRNSSLMALCFVHSDHPQILKFCSTCNVRIVWIVIAMRVYRLQFPHGG